MAKSLVRGWTKHLTPPVPGWQRTDLLDRRLVGEWRFDENTGLMLPDYTGRGNHATVIGADWITSEVGPCLEFVTANSDYVDTGVERIGGTGLFCNAGEQFTVECWFKVENGETGYVVARAGAADRTFGIWFQGGVHSPSLYIRGVNSQTNFGYDDGTWHGVWFTWDGVTGTVYGDGGKDTHGCAIGAAAENVGQRIIFGARTNGTGFHLDGLIAGVRIHDRALIAAEIRARYEICLKRAQPMTHVWMMPWGMAPAAPPVGGHMTLWGRYWGP